MADDLNKNITITVTAQTDTIQQNIVNLNKTIDDLLQQQKQLDTAGQQNSATYDSIAAKIDTLQKNLKDATTQLNAQTTAFDNLGKTAKTSDTALGSLNTQLQNTQKAVGDSSSKTKDLTTQLNSLGQATKQQKSGIDSATTSLSKHASSAVKSTSSSKNLSTQLNSLGQATKQQKSSIDSAAASISKHASNTAKSASSTKKLKSNVDQTATAFHGQVSKINDSKKAFDGHKQTIDLLKTSFDRIKGISGEFGPSLQDVAQGFNAMKSGFEVVKGGLKGIGEAMEADGFGLLLDIVQQLIATFINSPTGTKVIQGAISAIGVVVNKVSDFFQSLKDGIMNAFSHPLESIKHLGQIIEQNIINRFKAFGVILDGIIHLDFKKIADGAIQASNGITDATDKMGTAFTKVKEGVVNTAGQMVTAFNDGYSKAGKAVGDNETYVTQSVDRQIAKYDALGKKIEETYKRKHAANAGSSHRDPQILTASGTTSLDDSTKSDSSKQTISNFPGTATATADAKTTVSAYKKAFTQIEAEAKASAGKIATNAISSLENSIKQQSEAKVAALEKDKNAELSNSSLTSAQKIAIQAKYKKQEDQVKKDAFKKEQEASIAQAVINGALAVTKATAQTGVLSAFAVPEIIAETAIEIAKIASQKPPAYAKGGLHYASDGRGGVLPGYSRTDNTNAYLRSGEGIVVSEAMRDPWARNLVSAINVGFGGRDFSTTNTGRGFAVGGIFTDGGDANRYYNQPVTDNKNLANSIAYQMVNNFPPVYVDVKDINTQQNILAQTINRVNL